MERKSRKFVIHKAVNGEPYFTLVASNGRVLMTSETYSSITELEDTLSTLTGKRMPEKVESEK